ncbi:unnamed protein product, partial [Chrysoparadoxa australica]
QQLLFLLEHRDLDAEEVVCAMRASQALIRGLTLKDLEKFLPQPATTASGSDITHPEILSRAINGLLRKVAAASFDDSKHQEYSSSDSDSAEPAEWPVREREPSAAEMVEACMEGVTGIIVIIAERFVKWGGEHVKRTKVDQCY